MSLLSSFETSRVVPLHLADLSPVAQDVVSYFRQQEYEVSSNRTATGGWHISISKGGTFASILGLKTALNITIETVGTNTHIQAGVGIFDLQALPTILTVFVFAPVLLAQLWGLIQQEKLDDEAVERVEQSLVFHAGTSTGSPTTGTGTGSFTTSESAPVTPGA